MPPALTPDLGDYLARRKPLHAFPTLAFPVALSLQTGSLLSPGRGQVLGRAGPGPPHGPAGPESPAQGAYVWGGVSGCGQMGARGPPWPVWPGEDQVPL